MRPPWQDTGARTSALQDAAHSRKKCDPAYSSIAPNSGGGPHAALAAVEEFLDHGGPADVGAGQPAGSGGPSIRDCPETVTPMMPMVKALALPKYKLAFCNIPKVASSQFKDMFNYINGRPAWAIGFERGLTDSMYPSQGVSWDEMTKENGWKFAAFTRDPALRYLSAFGDMCPVNGTSAPVGHQLSCCGPAVDANAPAKKQAEALQARVEFDVKTGRPALDQHWASQTEVLRHCGWEKFRPAELDYWGILAGDVNAQVKEMMHAAGYGDDSVVDRFFPEEGTAGHTSYLAGDPPEYIHSAEVLEGIVELYADDYMKLPGVGCAFTEPLLAKLRERRAGNAQRH